MASVQLQIHMFFFWSNCKVPVVKKIVPVSVLRFVLRDMWHYVALWDSFLILFQKIAATSWSQWLEDSGENWTHRCQICDKKFKNYRDLVGHTAAKHNARKHFKCHLCDKEYCYKCTLSDHLVSAHGYQKLWYSCWTKTGLVDTWRNFFLNDRMWFLGCWFSLWSGILVKINDRFFNFYNL